MLDETRPRVFFCPQCKGVNTLPDRDVVWATCQHCGLSKPVVHYPDVVQVIDLGGVTISINLN